MDILPILQTWLLLIFIQFTPLTGGENGQQFVFEMSSAPGSRFTVELMILRDPDGQTYVGAKGAFSGGVFTEQVTAVFQGLGNSRTLVNVEDHEGIDLVKAGTKAKFTLFPGKRARLLVLQGDRLDKAACVREQGKSPREVEFTLDGTQAVVSYDPAKGLQRVRFGMPGLGQDLELVAVAPGATPTPTVAKRGPAAAPPTARPIVKEFRGLVSAAMFLAPGGKMPMEAAPEEQLVIDRQDAYRKFVARIYPEVVTMTSPAPKSDDPLLQMPPIDFSRQRLIVLLANDGMYGAIEMGEITEKNGRLVIHCRYAKPTMAERGLQQPLGLGRYRAFLLEIADRPVTFEVQKEP